MVRRALGWAALSLVLAGCGTNDTESNTNSEAMGGAATEAGSGGSATSGTTSTGGDSGAPGGDCEPVEATHPDEGALHVTECSPVSYDTKPPSSGNHYQVWAAFGSYDFPLPQGYWVHNLEHGAVVVSYNCPNGCADEVQRATAWLADLPLDASCTAQGASAPRALLVPDPTLDVSWGASAWGVTLRSDCFDEDTFSAFYDAHVGQGLEDVCQPGADFRNADGSRSAELPANCGE